MTDYHDAGNSEWKYTYDALGRITEVQGMDPYGSGSLGLVTNYAYDALGDLTSVDQLGVSPETPRLRSFVYDGLSRLVSATNPESGLTTYRYANSGGLLCSGDPSYVCSRTDARGIVTTYNYDALNRLTGKSYSNQPANEPTPNLSITWDPSPNEPPVENENNMVGQVTEIDSTMGSEAVNTWETGDYDQRGNSMGYEDCLWQNAANCVQEATTAYNYNLDGSPQVYSEAFFPTQTSTPADSVVNYSYDGAGRLSKIAATAYPDTSHNSVSATLFASPTYNAMAALTSAQLALDPASQVPGISMTRGYDSRLRLTAETDTNDQLATLYNYSVAYDGAGDVIGFNDSAMGTWNLVNDHLHRLYQGAATAGAYSGLNYQYVYDSFGNATQRLFSGSSNQSAPASTNPTYNASNQMTGLAYDADGNVTDDGTNRYLYDAEGRICATQSDFTLASTGYLYDGMGNRLAKGTLTSFSCDLTTNGFAETSVFVPGLHGEQLQEDDSSGNLRHLNVFLGGRVLATYAGSGYVQANWHYSLSDWVGTRRVQANAEGVTEGTFQSMPFGDGLTTTGTSGATENEFTGKERDPESGSDYFPARYYASSAGRFLSPDWSATPSAVPYANPSNPQSLNLYAYAFDNPLSFIDESGHEGEYKPSCTSAHYSSVYGNCMEELGVLEEYDEFDLLQLEFSGMVYKNVQVNSSATEEAGGAFLMATERDGFPATNADLVALFGGGGQTSGSPQTPAPNNATPSGGSLNQLQQLANGFSALTHPLDMLAVNASMFVAAGGQIVGGTAAVVGGCLEPTPFEPATCAAGAAAGGVVIPSGVATGAYGVYFFKNYTLPALKEWWQQ